VPKKDIYHDVIKNALIKGGWTITADPLVLSFGKRDVYVDLGAERPIAAEKEGRKIAVEIKSFLGQSDIRELENALGQYILYRMLLAREEPKRKLYLAIEQNTYKGSFSEPIGEAILEEEQIPLIIFNKSSEVIVQWIH
jgi:hypothetical protein